MWIFSRKSHPYSLSKQLFESHSILHYILYDCTRDSDQKELSAFEILAEKTPLQQSLLQNAIKIWKTFRHPAIPTFIDTYENNGSTYVITEKLLPFNDQILSNAECAWAIYTMVDFISFLGEDSQAVHGNLQNDAIFMTPGHELKIAGLHWVTVNGVGPFNDFHKEWSITTTFEGIEPSRGTPAYSIDLKFIATFINKWSPKLTHEIIKYGKLWGQNQPINQLQKQSVEYRNYNSGNNSNSQYADQNQQFYSQNPNIFQHQTQMQDQYQNHHTDNNQNLNQFQYQSPNQVDLSYDFPIQNQQFANQNQQFSDQDPDFPSPKMFLADEYWKEDKFMQTLLFLKDLPLKESTERENFYMNFLKIICIFSPSTQEYFLLPKFVSALSYSQSPAILEDILAIGKNIEQQKFDKVIIPIILPLFEIKNRSFRIHLLRKIEKLVSYFSEKEINEKVFPNVIIGLNDTAVALKSETIISMVYLAPKLNSMNGKMFIRELKRLQLDNEASIRCNSVICMAKIAKFIDEELRTQTLLAFFSKSAKDAFPPTRKASILAFRMCQQYFSLEDLASTVMPVIAPLCADTIPENCVMAAKTMKDFVHKFYISLNIKEEEPIETNSTSINSTTQKFDSQATENPTNAQINTSLGSSVNIPIISSTNSNIDNSTNSNEMNGNEFIGSDWQKGNYNQDFNEDEYWKQFTVQEPNDLSSKEANDVMRLFDPDSCFRTNLPPDNNFNEGNSAASLFGPIENNEKKDEEGNQNRKNSNNSTIHRKSKKKSPSLFSRAKQIIIGWNDIDWEEEEENQK
ncbi:hypothetical protein TRFO_02990 [Tritrichomonas foetus]|uniref:Protein kinase domain-containing protein n=1 Tax=Tritrichomonas foetus TaxID=1144522 RepID=A0A1J4KTZ1_9EUKA|nr:hypothetical protein TRFO_02990 [Tritrichomonas foetus]|eukprot:OHT14731.1 hypothetical protein TRFO_02990 [Tritrichomonas foetus]